MSRHIVKFKEIVEDLESMGLYKAPAPAAAAPPAAHAQAAY